MNFSNFEYLDWKTWRNSWVLYFIYKLMKKSSLLYLWVAILWKELYMGLILHWSKKLNFVDFSLTSVLLTLEDEWFVSVLWICLYFLMPYFLRESYNRWQEGLKKIYFLLFHQKVIWKKEDKVIGNGKWREKPYHLSRGCF